MFLLAPQSSHQGANKPIFYNIAINIDWEIVLLTSHIASPRQDCSVHQFLFLNFTNIKCVLPARERFWKCVFYIKKGVVGISWYAGAGSTKFAC